MAIESSFNNWFNEKQAEIGRSSRQIASEAGISHAALSAMRRGAQPSEGTCIRLARRFKSDPFSIMKLAGHQFKEELPIDDNDPRLDLFRELLALAPEDQEPVRRFAILTLNDVAQRRSRQKKST